MFISLSLSILGLEGTLLNQLIESPIRLSGLIVHNAVDLSSVFDRLASVQSVSSPFLYSPSTQRIRPCAMSLAWWLGLDPFPSVITVDGHPLGQIRRLRHEQMYANPLAKVSLFRLYLQLVKILPTETTSYAHAKTLSSNRLRDEYLQGYPQWPITDPDVFYRFILKWPSNSFLWITSKRRMKASIFLSLHKFILGSISSFLEADRFLDDGYEFRQQNDELINIFSFLSTYFSTIERVDAKHKQM